jgi:hypothetical protein
MKILKILFILFCLVLLGYLVLPNYNFPKPPPDSLRSQEPADTETPLRRAYFTNYSRSEVLEWYKSQFNRSTVFNIPLPTYLLNYPPEDAQTIIRDQTRSTFLEEVVHPLRESIYVNGYEPAPSDKKNAINIEGRNWRQKIIIRFIPSLLYIRLAIFAGIATMSVILFLAFKKSINDLKREKLRI